MATLTNINLIGVTHAVELIRCQLLWAIIQRKA